MQAAVPGRDDIREASKLTKDEWREFTKTVWHIANTSHPRHPAVFPIEIPHRLIKLFSFVGETVLDPFAGTGTTVRAAFDLQRRAIAVELNQTYVELMQSALDTATATILQHDSRDLGILGAESVDLVITSPPYWNKADYGDHEANLGNVDAYSGFLTEIGQVFRECFRLLRPGRKMCVVTANVNQHTEHGLLTFPLAADFVHLLRDAGFVMVNEVIWSKDRTGGRWGSANMQRPIFGSYPYPPNFLFKNVHEHILVFAKPSAVRRTGKTVVAYAAAMNGTTDGTRQASRVSEAPTSSTPARGVRIPRVGRQLRKALKEPRKSGSAQSSTKARAKTKTKTKTKTNAKRGQPQGKARTLARRGIKRGRSARRT